MYTPIQVAPAPHQAGLSLAALQDPLIAMADPTLDSHILVVSPGALDLACDLLHRGYRTASIVRVDQRMTPHQADVVIIPQPATPDFIERAIPFARRMLAPMGVIAIRLALTGDASRAWARHQLLLNGFTAIRVETARGETLIGAELPLHNRGRLACT